MTNRITTLFLSRKQDEKIMSLFITAGYPDLESSVELILGLEKNGADMIEIGIPFSDPLADGPTIQYSSDIAISNGITMNGIFEIVREIRKKSEIPVILMGYMNPILQYGIGEFCVQASESGVDGLIIPDIPLEELNIISHQAKKTGLHVILLAAPNTSDERLLLIDEKSQGFVYCVSVTGVTGSRNRAEIVRSSESALKRLKTKITNNPIMVGFGIKNHEDAIHIASIADGFIVGSALINTIKKYYPDKNWKQEVFSFVRTLKFGK